MTTDLTHPASRAQLATLCNTMDHRAEWLETARSCVEFSRWHCHLPEGNTDAVFNIGCAVGAVQSQPPGVYLAMNGRVFDPARVRKNRERHCFEGIV